MNEVLDDLYRYKGNKNINELKKLKRIDKGFAFLYYWRTIKGTKSLIKKFYSKWLIHRISSIRGIEIPLSVEIGKGFCMIHPYNITINSKAKIGKNLTILKGATIGNTKGKKNGTPVIGDNVYIGLNSSVVGPINVGNDVLIAANTFVNFDVPDHSIVIGSPGVIHHKDFATKEYIQNPIE